MSCTEKDIKTKINKNKICRNPNRESKSREPLELLEIGLRNLASHSQVATPSHMSLGFQLHNSKSRVSLPSNINDWNRQKSLKRPKTCTLKENIKNNR
ncbi:hypothetical protein ACOSQ4_003153 [Xanthoceras sorbifolium]